MKKRQVKRLANQLMAAAVLFSQAVFLLAPVSFAAAQSALTIQFNPYPPSVTSSDLNITATTNFADASVDFMITGPQSLYYPPVTHASGSLNYSFTWQASTFLAGNYQVRAQASRAGETPSVTATIMVYAGASDTIAPSAPTNLVATALAYNYVTLNWQASTDNLAVNRYQVYRNTSGSWVAIGQPNTNAYADTTVTAGSPYYYKVVAFDAAGNQSAPSSELFLNVPAAAAPNPPANLQATQSGTSININWTNSTGATHYAVQRSINAASYIALTTDTTVNYYSDTTVTAGSNYTYRVFACASSCSSTAIISNSVLVSTAGGVSTSSVAVLAPSNLTVSLSGTTITLNWTDNSNNESGFKIYRYKNSLWTDIGNVASNITTKIEPSVPAGTYKYKVQAFVSDGTYPAYSTVSNETPYITVASTTLSDATTSTTAVDATSTAPNYWIDFYQPPSLLSTSSKIFARTNILADRVDFTIQNFGSFIGELQPISTTDTYYYYAFRWDLSNYSNNTYQLKVFGSKGAAYFNSQYVSVQVLKPVSIIDLNKATSTIPATPNQISTSTIIKQPATINLFQPTNGATLNGWAKLQANSYGPIRRVEISKIADNLSASLGNAVLNSANNSWEFGWDTTKTADGDYALRIFAWDEQNYKITGNTINVKLANTPSSPDVAVPAQPTTIQKPNPIIQPTTTEPTKPVAAKPAPQPIEEKPPLAPTKNIEEILQGVTSQVDSRCQAAGINDQLKCDNFIAAADTPETAPIKAGQTLPAECQNANINDPNECEMLIRTEYVAFECKQAGLTTKAKCRDFMQSHFGQPAACAGLSDLACQKLISQVILADFVDQKIIDQANREVGEISGKYLELIQSETAGGTSRATIKEDTATLSKIDSTFDSQDIKTIESVLPFAKSEKQLNLLILSSTADAEKSKMLVGANALIDSDADGLTDDIETRLGTDKMNADSDGDGYSDGIEVRSGHNPLGAGELKIKLKPMELAIINKVKLEQPKLSGETRADILKIQRITNDQFSGSTASTTVKDKLKLQGRALPNDVVSLYIYSVMPIVVTVATDENGNWTYDLDKSLINGKHEAYVVINDEAGKIKAKSAPFSFFINEAKAVSQNDFLGADFAVPDRTTELTGWYVSGSLLLIVLVLGGYLLYQKRKEKNIVYSK